MRNRGASIADIAILVVSAEDGVKTQTMEAWKTATEANIPVIVAINKIDKPNANIEKTKIELAEHEIYLENYGGQTPCVEISAKVGTGVDNLLSLILLIAEMNELKANTEEPASGYVIEANLDSKRGMLATLIIKNGTLTKGMVVMVGEAMCACRIIENFKGEMVNELSFPSPARIVGFDKLPKVGSLFQAFLNKKEALEYIELYKEESRKSEDKNKNNIREENQNKKIIPIFLKADVAGTLEAIEKEVLKIRCKINADCAEFKIIGSGVGPISESDIKNIAGNEDTLVIGFNVKADRSAIDTAEKRGIQIGFFDIIYKMTEWLETEIENRRPKIETIETTGKAKILRAFSRTKERQILGGRVTEGKIVLNGTIKIMRRDFEIGRGKIVNLEKNKTKVSSVDEGSEFGMMIESKFEIAENDVIELFSIEQK
jgi:translation initiation factor IF-2